MQYRRRRRGRYLTGAVLMAALAASPVIISALRGDTTRFAASDIAAVYLNGLNAFPSATWIALPLAGIFALCLFAGQVREVNRKWLDQGARSRRHTVEGLRTFLIIAGGASIISSVLIGFYAILLMLSAGTGAGNGLPLLLMFAFPGLVLGVAAYALGRVGRPPL